MISIHALREEGDYRLSYCFQGPQISIHALREEGDRRKSARGTSRHYFYPRPPRGGRPSRKRPSCRRPKYFYPRPPRGGRRMGNSGRIRDKKFLSTPSARRATELGLMMPTMQTYFYPRPPRGGRPCRPHTRGRPTGYFYPRPPRGGRPLSLSFLCPPSNISIHALREEGDFHRYPSPPQLLRFLSTPSARRATGWCLAD